MWQETGDVGVQKINSCHKVTLQNFIWGGGNFLEETVAPNIQMLVHFYQSARCHISEDSKLQR